jgi:hypothetical protein
MNPIEHFFIGWCVANVSSEISARERMIITAAAIAPDLDGLGMLVEVPMRNTSETATRGTRPEAFATTGACNRSQLL